MSLGAAYRLERELGGGGMSRVFLAEEVRLGRRVVVKVLSPALAAEVSADRFEREIRVAAQLQDPRIVPLLSAGDAGGVAFYTMPFVEGESLRARLERGRLPLPLAISILRDVALALDYAHARGVIHRDIKPENVLLSAASGRGGGSATAMVTDFGLAKAVTAATGGDAHDTLTQVGLALGTPAYMAPEQAVGGVVDHRTDLYAWGIMAYELLAGEHPFHGKGSARAVVAAHIAEAPPTLAGRVPGLARGVAAVVDRALAKDSAARPESAGELVAALDAAMLTPVPAARRPALLAGAALAGLLLLAGGLWMLRRGGDGAKGGASSPRSVAVLPFANVGGDTADVYFADGMADELTTALAKVPGVQVAARSSSFRFRGSASTAREVGRALAVDAVLDGTVRRAGDRLRVSAQLTSAADGLVLWAERYDRRTADVFSLQDEIAGAIVAALRGTLAGDSAAATAPRGTADLEAYDLYLRGRYFWARRGDQGLRTAVGLFDRAAARDPGFARAHAGLAMSHVLQPMYAGASPDSTLPVAERSALRALALDSTLADAHLALAAVRKMQWRWDEAETHFRASIALAPDDPTAHQWFGGQLYALGRVDESIAELRRARALDPLSSALATDLVYGLYAGRRYDEALAEARRMVELDTTMALSHLLLGVVELARGRADTALPALERAHRLSRGVDIRPYLMAAHRALGHQDDVRRRYAELRRDHQAGRTLAYDLALAATVAGDLPAALAAAGRAIERREPLVSEFSLPCEPLLDPLKVEPGFRTMLSEAGMRICEPATGAVPLAP